MTVKLQLEEFWRRSTRTGAEWAKEPLSSFHDHHDRCDKTEEHFEIYIYKS